MSVGSNIRLAGFTTLLAINGESVTWRVNGLNKGVLTAIVNRQVLKAQDSLSVHDGSIDFTLKGVTELGFLRSVIMKPRIGDVFSDTFGYWHRIKMVCSTDITWVCYCIQSDQTGT